MKVFKSLELYELSKKVYGSYRGYYKIDLALEWFNMSNDDFFDKFKFNFNPHSYTGLYKIAQKIYFSE